VDDDERRGNESEDACEWRESDHLKGRTFSKENARGYGGGNDIGERNGVQSEGTRSW